MDKKIILRKYFYGNSERYIKYKYKYFNMLKNLKVVPKTILYESRDGNSFVDSPYQIFLQLIINEKYKDYSHYIVVTEESREETEKAINLIQNKKNENIKYVVRNSLEYLKLLATAQYLVNNSTFQNFFIKNKGQVYINTWHGTPLKFMGFDIPGNPAHSQNVLRNYLQADYLLSPNSHTTKIFMDSYKLDGLFEGIIVEDGYPRIDNTLNPKIDVKEKAKKFGLRINSKPLILYSPTWSGSSVSSPTNNVKQLINEFFYLQNHLSNKYQIIVKVHPYLYKYVKDIPELSGYLVPDSFDVNELLSIVDLLITDYSSIFFDFLVTEKPIFFYCPDYEQYLDDRGVYINLDDLPGSLSTTVMELCEKIDGFSIDNFNKNKILQYKNRYCSYDDGKVTNRLISIVFDNDQHVKSKVNLVSSNNEKKKIIFYPGGMKNNGITSSFINLLNNIDYSKYDVSILSRPPKNWESDIMKNISKLPKGVRFLFNGGTPAYTLNEDIADEKYRGNPESDINLKNIPIAAYKREFHRIAGDAKFDVAIDFSGYSYFWGKYIAFSNAPKKLVFMHNDLFLDSNKVINNKKVHYNNLTALFKIYDYFDVLLSVSKATMHVNKGNLSHFVSDPDKFQYCINTINPEQILSKASIEIDPIITDSNKSLNVRKLSDNGKANDNTIKFYQDFNHILNNSYINYSFEENEIVEITASMTVEDETYFKILKNHILIGWTSSQNISKVYDDILENVSYRTLYRLIYPGNHTIWKYPYHTTTENYKVTFAKTLRGIYFWSTQMIKTNRSTYVNIILNGKEIGWIDIRSSKDMLQNQNEFMKRYFINKSTKVNKDLNFKIVNNAHSLYSEHSYVKLNLGPKDKIWKKPYGVFKNKPITLPLNYNDSSIYEVKSKAVTKKSTYLNIYMGKIEIGWVDENAVHEVSKEKIETIRQYNVDRTIKLMLGKKDSVWEKPYGVSNNKKVTFFENNEIFSVDSIVQTVHGLYCHIISDRGMSGYVDQKCCITITDNTLTDINGKVIGAIDNTYKNFINMGRLSPEKNQENLIRAFQKFVSSGEKAKLYIMGAGPLKEELIELINSLDIGENIVLLGQKDNPFSILKKCDYFILPSIYEGQPMVLLEGLTLGMNIIASDIPANNDVLKGGKLGTLIPGTEVEDIYQTLVEKKYNENKDISFNPNLYNKEAVSSFEKFLK